MRNISSSLRVSLAIDCDVVAINEFDADFKTMSGRDSLSNPRHTVMNHSSGDFTDGSNRAFYFCEFWNHIGCRASVELSDGEDAGVKDIDSTSDH